MAQSSDQTVVNNQETSRSWQSTMSGLLKPEVLTMLFYGFSAGVPLMLIFSALSLWLSEAGIEKSTVTYFSWAALAYSFKFLWAPIIDRIPVPFLSKKLGRRRGWLLTSQLMIIAAILLMASTNPVGSMDAVTFMAMATILLGFSSATQDIVIDAYRIEVAKPELQAFLASTYIAGYRVGMIVAGAGALVLAEELGSSKAAYDYQAWQTTYMIMAAAMLVGVITTLTIREPNTIKKQFDSYTNRQYIYFFLFFIICAASFVFGKVMISDGIQIYKDPLSQFLNNKVIAGLLIEIVSFIGAVPGMLILGWSLGKAGFVDTKLIKESYWFPIRDFFRRYGVKLALLLLLFIGFYRVSDIVLGVISYVFYYDMGYTKTEIAAVSKTFGLVMTILGGFLGGILSLKYGVMRILFLGALLTVLTNLLFMVVAQLPPNLPLLYAVISADNISGGLASAAFIAFLASITNVSFTASQYAIFSSLMTLFPKMIGGYSGSMVESIGYSNFFLLASLMGVPVLYLIYLLKDKLKLESRE